MKNSVNISSSSKSSGIGFIGALTIAFIILKLLNIIKWSWLWVLSPLWISTALVVLLIIVLFIWAIIAMK